jgi:hypothetical protein
MSGFWSQERDFILRSSVDRYGSNRILSEVIGYIERNRDERKIDKFLLELIVDLSYSLDSQSQRELQEKRNPSLLKTKDK